MRHLRWSALEQRFCSLISANAHLTAYRLNSTLAEAISSPTNVKDEDITTTPRCIVSTSVNSFVTNLSYLPNVAPTSSSSSSQDFSRFTCATGSTNFHTNHQLLCDYSLRRVTRHNPTSTLRRTAKGASSIDRPHIPSVEVAGGSSSFMEGGTDSARQELTTAFRILRDTDQSEASIRRCSNALLAVTLVHIVGKDAMAAICAVQEEGHQTPLDDALCEDVDLELATLVTNTYTLIMPMLGHLKNDKASLLSRLHESFAAMLPLLAACVGPACALLIRDANNMAERQRLDAIEAAKKLRVSAKETGATVSRDPGSVGKVDPQVRLQELTRLWETFFVGSLWAVSSLQPPGSVSNEVAASLVGIYSTLQTATFCSDIAPALSLTSCVLVSQTLTEYLVKIMINTAEDQINKSVIEAVKNSTEAISAVLFRCSHVAVLEPGTMTEIAELLHRAHHTQCLIRFFTKTLTGTSSSNDVDEMTLDATNSKLAKAVQALLPPLNQKLQRVLSAPLRSTGTRAVCDMALIVSGYLNLINELQGTANHSTSDCNNSEVILTTEFSDAVETLDLCLTWLRGLHAHAAWAEVMVLATRPTEISRAEVKSLLSLLDALASSPFALKRYKKLPLQLWLLSNIGSKKRENSSSGNNPPHMNSRVLEAFKRLGTPSQVNADGSINTEVKSVDAVVTTSGPLDYKLNIKRLEKQRIQNGRSEQGTRIPNSTSDSIQREKPPPPSAKSKFRFSSKIRGPRESMPRRR